MGDRLSHLSLQVRGFNSAGTGLFAVFDNTKGMRNPLHALPIIELKLWDKTSVLLLTRGNQ